MENFFGWFGLNKNKIPPEAWLAKIDKMLKMTPMPPSGSKNWSGPGT